MYIDFIFVIAYGISGTAWKSSGRYDVLLAITYN